MTLLLSVECDEHMLRQEKIMEGAKRTIKDLESKRQQAVSAIEQCKLDIGRLVE